MEKFGRHLVIIPMALRDAMSSIPVKRIPVYEEFLTDAGLWCRRAFHGYLGG